MLDGLADHGVGLVHPLPELFDADDGRHVCKGHSNFARTLKSHS